jgi:hypothetical protein
VGFINFGKDDSTSFFDNLPGLLVPRGAESRRVIQIIRIHNGKSRNKRESSRSIPQSLDDSRIRARDALDPIFWPERTLWFCRLSDQDKGPNAGAEAVAERVLNPMHPHIASSYVLVFGDWDGVKGEEVPH